jgi:alpha-beta hydrolase superfamily lysophospholipase
MRHFIGMKRGWFRVWIWRITTVLASVVALVLALRVMQSERQPDLAPWHTWAPHELSVGELEKADWQTWLTRETRLFAEGDQRMREKLEPDERRASNRYFEGSPVYPGRFAHNWNRSYVLLPEGQPRGAVVLLHGLSDSPYSLRHVARIYAAHGYAAVGLRLPGHGTVPAGLASARWQDWQAATRLAVREAQRLAGPGKPLHIVGYSNGGALAVQYTADAARDSTLALPSQVVLFSPMIGVTRFARYAGIAGWPALLPRFSKSAWLEIVPEFNPFKYGSFPVNAARQSYELTQVLNVQFAELAKSGALARFPPVLAFQSAVDSTVLGDALVTGLFDKLPKNGSEIVVFDVNRATPLDLLLSQSTLARVDQMLPAIPHNYRVTVIGNSPRQARVSEYTRASGETNPVTRGLELAYPEEFFSLSHVALPFPPDDSLYGTHPDGENFGIHLGNQALRGELGTLLKGADSLMRASCNPFFPYVITRVEEIIH